MSNSLHSFETAGGEPSGICALRTLYSGPFGEDWTARCLSILRSRRHSAAPHPLILLPTDIQREDYEGHFEVLHGEEADRMLRACLGASVAAAASEGCDSTARRTVFIDFSPDVLPEDAVLLPLLLARLSNWPRALPVIVAAPDPVPFADGLFDRHAPLEFARGSAFELGSEFDL